MRPGFQSFPLQKNRWSYPGFERFPLRIAERQKIHPRWNFRKGFLSRRSSAEERLPRKRIQYEVSLLNSPIIFYKLLLCVSEVSENRNCKRQYKTCLPVGQTTCTEYSIPVFISQPLLQKMTAEFYFVIHFFLYFYLLQQKTTGYSGGARR